MIFLKNCFFYTIIKAEVCDVSNIVFINLNFSICIVMDWCQKGDVSLLKVNRNVDAIALDLAGWQGEIM